MQDTVAVAKNLLGKKIVHIQNGVRLSGMIVETEAYIGTEDTACHAHKGKTKRTEIMFRKAGIAYIYLIYGMHELFNVVTRDEGMPEAVLIRAVEPMEGIGTMKKNRPIKGAAINLTNGPGKWTRAMNLTRAFNGYSLQSDILFIEEYQAFVENEITSTKRIGVEYAKGWRNKKLRFYITKNHAVSK